MVNYSLYEATCSVVSLNMQIQRRNFLDGFHSLQNVAHTQYYVGPLVLQYLGNFGV